MRACLYASIILCVAGGSVRGEIDNDNGESFDVDSVADIGEDSLADIGADVGADIDADIGADVDADIDDMGTVTDTRPKPKEDEAKRKEREERMQKYATEALNLKSGPFKVDRQIADALAEARERTDDDGNTQNQGETGDFEWRALGKRDIMSKENGGRGDALAKLEQKIHKERGTVQKGQIAFPRSAVERAADYAQELRDGKELPDARFYAPKAPDSSRRQLVQGVTLTSADGKKIIGKQENGGVETEFSQKPGEKDQVMEWKAPVDVADELIKEVASEEKARLGGKTLSPSTGTIGGKRGQMISAVEKRGDIAMGDARDLRDISLAASNVQTSLGAYLNRRKEVNDETSQLFELKHKHEDILESLEHSYDVLLGELGRIMQAKDDVQATNEFKVLIQVAKRVSNERRIVKEYTKNQKEQQKSDTLIEEDVAYTLNKQANLINADIYKVGSIIEDIKGLEKVAGYEADPEETRDVGSSSYADKGPRSVSALEMSVGLLDTVDPDDLV